VTATTYQQLIESLPSDGPARVSVQRRGEHAVVTMREPERLNALSVELTVALREALEELARDPGVRAVVLTGADPAFSAGGDLRLMAESGARISRGEDPDGATTAWRFIRRQFGGVVRTIVRSETPFIAALNGPAAGVGLAFALACDLILASERAIIVPAFGRLGLVPEVGTSWLLTRRLGYQRTFEYWLAGEHLSAARAHELGLVNQVVPHDELLPAAEAWCERIAALPRHVVEMGKPLLRAAADASWEHALTLEEYAEPMCFTTAAFPAAVEAVRTPA
jgi:2-(1,2-epoxy-1,2-dihydrophenyl)acetyl-CoA isomerase